MIVIDTSALIAILEDEPDRKTLEKALARAPRKLIAATTKLEALIVAGGRHGIAGQRTLNTLLDINEIGVVAWDEAMTAIAADAFLRFGKGRGHKAALNFGDCMSYALAKSLDAPLLFKGDDFAATDIRSALP